MTVVGLVVMVMVVENIVITTMTIVTMTVKVVVMIMKAMLATVKMVMPIQLSCRWGWCCGILNIRRPLIFVTRSHFATVQKRSQQVPLTVTVMSADVN